MRRELHPIGQLLLKRRGHATGLGPIFETTAIPMVWIDNDGRWLDANPAACLLLRRTRDELRWLRLHELVPGSHHVLFDERRAVLQANGTVAGSMAIRTPDGALMLIDYWAVANLLPGAHLVLGVPSRWTDDEIAAIEGPDVVLTTGPLTEREREVTALLAAGATVTEISDQLSLSPHTVRTHFRNAVRRLGARNRTHAIALALREGVI